MTFTSFSNTIRCRRKQEPYFRFSFDDTSFVRTILPVHVSRYEIYRFTSTIINVIKSYIADILLPINSLCIYLIHHFCWMSMKRMHMLYLFFFTFVSFFDQIGNNLVQGLSSLKTIQLSIFCRNGGFKAAIALRSMHPNGRLFMVLFRP